MFKLFIASALMFFTLAHGVLSAPQSISLGPGPVRLNQCGPGPSVRRFSVHSSRGNRANQHAHPATGSQMPAQRHLLRPRGAWK
ncbi:hypothetical protein B0H13DRAFT_1973368 [Mycena leptocephala]|nr:hypothetical protein B0H13DRAFT_1973368 [Mycena leptocephala]